MYDLRRCAIRVKALSHIFFFLLQFFFFGSSKQNSLEKLGRISDLSEVEDVFSRWRERGITKNMIDCCGSLIVRNATDWDTPPNLKRISIIRVRNGTVTVTAFNSTASFQWNDASPRRMRAYKIGVTAAIQFAKDNLNISAFPDFQALFVPSDDARTIRPLDSKCVCQDNVYDWPPILAQNRIYMDGNLFVTVPDFSFFSRFKFPGNHGTKEDIWFDVMREEEKRYHGINSTFQPCSFNLKPFAEVVWRGRITQRDWGPVREAVSKCNITGLSNTNGDFISRSKMCSRYQMILTLPGNGVWSWATKFNLLCNSVTVLISPDELNGESWETRRALGLRLNQHYLGVTANVSEICNDLIQKVLWVRQHPKRAQEIADSGRALVLEKLSRNAILRDFATLLLDYASLFRSNRQQVQQSNLNGATKIA